MAKGLSGRVVIEVEPELKRELYGELARRGLTLKAWFIGQATHFLDTSHQPSLFEAADTNSHRPQLPNGTHSTAGEDGE